MSADGRDTDEPMTQEEIRGYRRQQRKLTRAAQKELEERQQLESTRGNRTAKTKALGNKIWLPAGNLKRPATEEKEPGTTQKKAKTSVKHSRGEKTVVDEKEQEKDAMSISGPAPRSVRPKPTPRPVDSDSSSLSDDLQSDDDDELGIEDSDLKSMTDEQLQQIVGVHDTVIVEGKLPNVGDKGSSRSNEASGLFDIPDSDVHIAIRSRPPSRASSRASGPPTSDFDEDPGNNSEGHADKDTQGDDSDDSDIRFGTRKRKQRPQKSTKTGKISKQEEKFNREQPQIKAAHTEQNKASNTKHSTKDDDDDTKWPEWTHLEYKAKGKLQLLQQHQVIRSVVRKAIELAEIDVITRLAWPELETSREMYRHRILHQAAKVLEKKDGKAGDVKDRVKASMKYASALGDLVMDRLSVMRSPARMVALSHIACFELGVDEVCQQR